MKKTPICYDSGPDSGSDRFTIVYETERHRERGRIVYYIGCNSMPHHPAFGIWQYGELSQQYQPNIFTWGRLNLRHLGKRVPFGSLPQAVQDTYRRSYNESVKPRTVAQVVEVDGGYVFTYNIRPLGRLVKYTAHWVSKEVYPFAPVENKSEFIGRTPTVRGRKTGWRNLAPYIVHRFLSEAQIPGAWHDQP